MGRWGWILVVLLMTGCGAAATTQPVKTDQVEMPRSYRLAPAVIEVTSGTTVTWHNSDNFSHSVVFSEGEIGQLVLQPGQSGSLEFQSPGEYHYVCSFHAQQMKGTVVVREVK